jgi:hypothetical protein
VVGTGHARRGQPDRISGQVPGNPSQIPDQLQDTQGSCQGTSVFPSSDLDSWTLYSPPSPTLKCSLRKSMEFCFFPNPVLKRNLSATWWKGLISRDKGGLGNLAEDLLKGSNWDSSPPLLHGLRTDLCINCWVVSGPGVATHSDRSGAEQWLLTGTQVGETMCGDMAVTMGSKSQENCQSKHPTVQCGDSEPSPEGQMGEPPTKLHGPLAQTLPILCSGPACDSQG